MDIENKLAVTEMVTRVVRRTNYDVGINIHTLVCIFPGGSSGKEPAYQCRRHQRHGFDPWVRKICWRRSRQPTPVFLPGEPHEQRSLVGYSSKSHKESDMTEVT